MSRLISTSSRVLLPSASKLGQSFLSTASSGAFTHKLPDLPYDYNALEPVITGQIMETHHKKHHQTYVNNLNNTLAECKLRTAAQ